MEDANAMMCDDPIGDVPCGVCEKCDTRADEVMDGSGAHFDRDDAGRTNSEQLLDDVTILAAGGPGNSARERLIEGIRSLQTEIERLRRQVARQRRVTERYRSLAGFGNHRSPNDVEGV